MDFVGHEFKQGPVEWFASVVQCLGPQLWAATIQRLLHSHLWCLGWDNWKTRTTGRSAFVWPPHVAWASSQCGDFLYGGSGFQAWELHPLFWPDLGSHRASFLPNYVVPRSHSSPRFKGRGHIFYLLRRECGNITLQRDIWDRGIVVAIYRKYTLPYTPCHPQLTNHRDLAVFTLNGCCILSKTLLHLY